MKTVKKEKIDLKTIYKQLGKEGVLKILWITEKDLENQGIYEMIPEDLKPSVRLPKLYIKSKENSTIDNEDLNNLVKFHASQDIYSGFIYTGVYHFNKGLICTNGERLLFYPCKVLKKHSEKCYTIKRYSVAQREKLIHFTFKQFSLIEAEKKADIQIHNELTEDLVGEFPNFDKIVQKDIKFYKTLGVEEILVKISQLIKIFSSDPKIILGSIDSINFNLKFIKDSLTFFYKLKCDKIFVFSSGVKMQQIIFCSSKTYKEYHNPFCLIMPTRWKAEFTTKII